MKENKKSINGLWPINKVCNVLFNYPTKEFHIRELSRLTKLSTTAVINAVTALQKQELVKIEENFTKNIKSNIESETYTHYKMLLNITNIIRLGIITEIKNIYNNPECITLFGSFARGEDIERSDIDILIITQNTKKNIQKEKISLWEKELNRTINLHILNSINKSSDEFKNAIANGMVLYGYQKVI